MSMVAHVLLIMVPNSMDLKKAHEDKDKNK